ncbi:hypothetical protein Sjap_020676 [Stephania japonica]|uniref:Uncharacterized protein n=1 Tax=Stephania japonica TaxID=461633 RepID=A0AAP0HZ75_9MAGN
MLRRTVKHSYVDGEVSGSPPGYGVDGSVASVGGFGETSIIEKKTNNTQHLTTTAVMNHSGSRETQARVWRDLRYPSSHGGPTNSATELCNSGENNKTSTHMIKLNMDNNTICIANQRCSRDVGTLVDYPRPPLITVSHYSGGRNPNQRGQT